MKCPPCLVVVSTQRSGSTLVCDDVEGTGVLGRPSEYYISLLQRLREGHTLPLQGIRDHLANRGTTPNGVVAVKVMAGHLPAIDRMYEAVRAHAGKDRMFPHFFGEIEGAHILRVVRKDRVAQAVSRIMAAKSQVYHRTEEPGRFRSLLGTHVSSERNRNEAFPYDESEIWKTIERIAGEERLLDRCLKQCELPVMNVLYEEIVEDRSYLHQLGDSLKVGNVTPRPRRLQKVAGHESDRWIRRFKAAHPRFDQ